MLTHPDTLAIALYRAQGGQWLPQELQARRENLRKARVSLEQQMERLTDAYLANVLQLEEYKRRRQELEQRLAVIAEQKRQLEASVGHHDQLAGMVQSIEAFCQRVQQGISEATFEQKRRLIELLIDRVVVTGEEVEIRYVIPTSSKSETIRFCHLRLDYFNRPMISHQFQQLGGRRSGGREAGHTIDDLSARLAIFMHGARQAKHLGDPRPLASQKVVEFSTGYQFADFHAPMSFVDGACRAPVPTVYWRLLKKELQVMSRGGLIAFGNENIVPIEAASHADKRRVGCARHPLREYGL